MLAKAKPSISLRLLNFVQVIESANLAVIKVSSIPINATTIEVFIII
jgi:hypothetical protein